MHGHGEKLTRLQEKAIAALLTADTMPDAAQQAGVNEATLRACGGTEAELATMTAALEEHAADALTP